MGRLINHSKNGNCQTKLHDINGVPHLILTASRNIDEGEELLYDYGDRSKASIAAHPWLKYWFRGPQKRKGNLTVTLAGVQFPWETECVPFLFQYWGSGGVLVLYVFRGGWSDTHHISVEVHLPFQMTSVLFIYVCMRNSGCFAAHSFLYISITYRPMLLQHAGSC